VGGFGSGNWYRTKKKATVEESLTLSMRAFRDRIFRNSSGILTWTWASGGKSSIGYFVTWRDVPSITLHYRWRDSEDVRIRVRLQTTPTHFGGERWWFTCPMIVGGVACDRRAGNLHLPPGAKYYGCRMCHDLTYRSCQKAHQAERLLASIGCMKARLVP
jgi:hypothetical protein